VNLIERLGGYEKTKDHRDYLIDFGNEFNRPNKYEVNKINNALLEYRRQHNIFEVGDWVFHTVCKNPLLERVTWVDGKRIRTDLAGSSAPTETFVHATTEEIKAGKRLEVK